MRPHPKYPRDFLTILGENLWDMTNKQLEKKQQQIITMDKEGLKTYQTKENIPEQNSKNLGQTSHQNKP
jgi:hypothetical protein